MHFWISALLSVLGSDETLPNKTPAPLRATLGEWNSAHAAHLLRRAGFGGTPNEIASLANLGREAAVDSLLRFGSKEFAFDPPTVLRDAPNLGKELRGRPEEEKEALKRFYRTNSQIHYQNLSEWWLRRMTLTPDPLQEKLVLFWHGHFTSGHKEVKDSSLLYRQNELFREYALGSFGSLLEKVTLDPAMLLYLDGDKNRKGKPNENFAREVMELFTMGPGNYSEEDIREAARSFTGWTLDRETGDPRFRKGQHDAGEKLFLGERGRFDGTDILRIILKQPATAEFLARKLWVFFVGDEPSEALREALAETLRQNGYELQPTLRALLLSDAFYAPERRFQNIKSPVELVVGTFRLLECQPVDGEYFQQALRLMGQELFQPPNVKGWEGGANWIDTSSLFARYNFGYAILYGSRGLPGRGLRQRMTEKMAEMLPEDMELSARDGGGNQPPYDPSFLLGVEAEENPAVAIDKLVQRLLQQEIHPEQRRLLLEHFEELRGPAPRPERASDAVRGIIHLILSMPEYQIS